MPKHRLHRLIRDPRARGAFFLFAGAVFHFLYGSFRLFIGILYRPYRVDAFAFFYLSLAFSRLFLIRAYREAEGERSVKYACRLSGRVLFVSVGFMLLLIAETLAGARSPYPFYALLVSGGYALSSAALSIAELLYLKRLRSLLLSASRAVGLASALLSAFNFLSDVLLSAALFPPSVSEALLLTLGALTLLFVLFLAVGISHKKSPSID